MEVGEGGCVEVGDVLSGYTVVVVPPAPAGME